MGDNHRYNNYFLDFDNYFVVENKVDFVNIDWDIDQDKITFPDNCLFDLYYFLPNYDYIYE